jgi:predicted transcriptional regulator
MIELQDFINTYIGSVEQLEILLLMQRYSDKEWCPKEITAQIRSNFESVSARLQGLLNNGLISKTENGKFKYAPPSEAIRDKVLELQAAYAQKRSKIINMIYTGNIKTGPSKSVRDLADAFRLDRGKD